MFSANCVNTLSLGQTSTDCDVY